MFYWENGLILRSGLAIDIPRRQKAGFISHAHSDHLAGHELALCTPETAALYQLRMRARRTPRLTKHLPFGKSVEWGGQRLTTYPSGHCLGSAMLLVEEEGQSLLYTGDFKLQQPASCPPAQFPTADILIIECTYGEPRWRFPSRRQIVEQLYQLVERLVARDCVPVIVAYALGKAQEATKLLTDAGYTVYQHPDVFRVSLTYERFGVSLGDFRCLSDADWLEPPAVAVVPPYRSYRDIAARPVSIALTGWALHPATRYRIKADYALPLSDHADFSELLQAVERVAPRVVYCTHGPAEFANRLQELGFDARPLGQPTQHRLF